MPFISFSSLIVLARTASTMLKRSGESGHLILFLLLKEKFNLSLLSMKSVVALSYMVINMLWYVPSIPNSLSFFIMR